MHGRLFRKYGCKIWKLMWQKTNFNFLSFSKIHGFNGLYDINFTCTCSCLNKIKIYASRILIISIDFWKIRKKWPKLDTFSKRRSGGRFGKFILIQREWIFKSNPEETNAYWVLTPSNIPTVLLTIVSLFRFQPPRNKTKFPRALEAPFCIKLQMQPPERWCKR